ncbi:MAG: HEAT repeat domain-containing protein [Chloroflexi bacterium]|nr:HEAT repeat domain-containing protein [Chloroflexota bacterium]
MLRNYLEHRDYTTITQLAATNKRVLSELIALTLDADEVIGWRAVKALGLASAVVAEHDAEFVRGILRRLMWTMNDESGSIGWRAPQAMGAIIAQRPHTFAEFITIVISLFDVEEIHFYPGILWAIGHIAERDPGRVRFALPVVLNFLCDASPQTRGMAVWCAGQLRDATAIPALQNLYDDLTRVCVFVDDEMREYSIGDLARDALARLDEVTHGKD